MRDSRAKDEHRVVNAGREQLVDSHWHCMIDQPTGQLPYRLSAQLAERYQFIRLIPAMIVEVTRKIRDADLRALLRLRHWRVRTLRHQHIERCNPTPREKLIRDWKQQVRVIVTRLIRNDRQHTLTRLDHLERLVNDR